jgi:hypothetical protein
MGGGGKGAQPVDRSSELYAQQQADLARQRAEQEDKERAAREAERQLQEDLRSQMLGQRNQLTAGGLEEDDLGTIQQNTLG